MQPQIVQLPTRRRATISEEDAIIERAMRILASRMKKPGVVLSNPPTGRTFLCLKLGHYEHEVFTVLYLDVKNRVIACEAMFSGTLTHTSVYPREIIKAALRHNAAGVILAHNHPSGDTEPSAADMRLTEAIKHAAELVDLRVLDHIIVAGTESYSMAEHGEM